MTINTNVNTLSAGRYAPAHEPATDNASETVAMTRSQILQQAASAILTQANGMPSAVLALLR